MTPAIRSPHPAEQIARAARQLSLLKECYPQASCALEFGSPFQLLAATILSAQCTDVRVNLVTRELFRRYPDAPALAGAELGDLEAVIRPTGFFRTKARHLLGCAAALVNAHGGEVPRDLAALVALPGVGRKTANVVLGNAFAIPGLVVDTHVGRLARRLGWSSATDPARVEAELCRLLPAAEWTVASHLLIHHGRALCRARRPQCSRCPLLAECPRLGVAVSS